MRICFKKTLCRKLEVIHLVDALLKIKCIIVCLEGGIISCRTMAERCQPHHKLLVEQNHFGNGPEKEQPIPHNGIKSQPINSVKGNSHRNANVCDVPGQPNCPNALTEQSKSSCIESITKTSVLPRKSSSMKDLTGQTAAAAEGYLLMTEQCSNTAELKNSLVNSFALSKTPTDEEINMLWETVRTYLQESRAKYICPSSHPQADFAKYESYKSRPPSSAMLHQPVYAQTLKINTDNKRTEHSNKNFVKPSQQNSDEKKTAVAVRVDVQKPFRQDTAINCDNHLERNEMFSNNSDKTAKAISNNCMHNPVKTKTGRSISQQKVTKVTPSVLNAHYKQAVQQKQQIKSCVPLAPYKSAQVPHKNEG